MSEIGGAILIAAFAILGKPLFWICVTAIICANIIATGLHQAARALGIAIIHASPIYPKFAQKDDDGDLEERYNDWEEDRAPPIEHAVREEQSKQAFNLMAPLARLSPAQRFGVTIAVLVLIIALLARAK